MFELSVACKYLLPRWRQLSVSIISIISTLVIALVVWLIVVFFSVKDGLENSWIEKIIALTAPVRVIPTEKYYASHYYLVDTISSTSGYTPKAIGEKLNAPDADPYNPEVDEEIPKTWPAPDRHPDGALKDLVKEAYLIANSLNVRGLNVSEFETTIANLRLRLLRQSPDHQSQQFLEHASFISSLDENTSSIAKALFPPTEEDLDNFFRMQEISSDNIQEETPDAVHRIEGLALSKRLQDIFQALEISALKVPDQGWRLPSSFLPSDLSCHACAIAKNGKVEKLLLPVSAAEAAPTVSRFQDDGWDALPAEFKIDNGAAFVKLAGGEFQPLAPWVPIMIDRNAKFKARLIEDSLLTAATLDDLRFDISTSIQGHPFGGSTSLGKLEISEVSVKKGASSLPFAYPHPDRKGIAMPKDTLAGDPILLPRNFRESGALIGDQGYISYYSPTPSSMQEQRLPVFIAGFYDPGIIPVGGKYVLAGHNLTSLLQASYNPKEIDFSNGINIHFDHISDAPKVKEELQTAFQKAGIAPYWKIETYQEFEFTKDIVQQLQSEKNLFSLISLVIIIVACSNIISMLIILVNDKKLEIGILRSMGASSKSIAAIFGVCGMVMGTIGSIIGIAAAMLTLRYVNELVGFLSRLQGYDLFNPVFYGTTLPSELSTDALTFVVITTALTSLLAGVVPAIKACMMHPSAILRSE